MPISELSAKTKNILYHVIAWTVFIAYECTLITIIRSAEGLQGPAWSLFIVPYSINIALFYVHALAVMEISFGKKQKHWFLFLFLLCAEIIIYVLLFGLKEHSLSLEKITVSQLLYPGKVAFSRLLFRGIYFLIFSTAFWLISKTFRRKQLLKEAETRALTRQKEKQALQLKLSAAQNAFLQAQINPHLLFNTLNFIHSEVQEVSEKASDAIITLSEMMRYSLAETRPDGTVELEQEMEQIRNLIRINQFRFNNQLFIQVNEDGDLTAIRIIPLVLLPFVENLFKYAELNDPDHPAKVDVRVTGNILSFTTDNKKRKTVNFRSPGIGIENIKTRLQAHYIGRHALCIRNTETHFNVELTIEQTQQPC